MVLNVGNIPYEATEEELVKFFSSVGDVKSFNLITDQSTGRSKGFGFCYFSDNAAAESAVRNINGQMLRDRALRVDLAAPRARERTHEQTPQGSHQRADRQREDQDPTEAKLYGESNPTGQNANKIAETLEKAPLHKIHQIMKEMKGFATKQPREASALLNAQPQLAFAFLQALLRLGMVDTATADRLLTDPNLGTNGIPPVNKSALLPPGPPPPAPQPQPAPPGPGRLPRDLHEHHAWPYDRSPTEMYEQRGFPPRNIAGSAPGAMPPPRGYDHHHRHPIPPPPHHRHPDYRGPVKGPPPRHYAEIEPHPHAHPHHNHPPPPHHPRRRPPMHPHQLEDHRFHQHPVPHPAEHEGHTRRVLPPMSVAPSSGQLPPGHPQDGQSPPHRQVPHQQPPPQQRDVPPAQQQNTNPEFSKEELIKRALSMPEEKINFMPKEMAAMFRQIRKKFGKDGS
eukprot:gene5000-6949_t